MHKYSHLCRTICERNKLPEGTVNAGSVKTFNMQLQLDKYPPCLYAHGMSPASSRAEAEAETDIVMTVLTVETFF